MTSLDPEAAALRDRAIAPVLEAIEACEIEQAWTAVEIEHARAKHPSTYPDFGQIEADLAEIAEGLGTLRTIDQLSPGDLVRIGDEWCVYEFVRGDVLNVTVEGACCFSEYPLSDGERFVWMPGHGGF